MFQNVTLMTVAKQRMDWAATRQEVIAENIANANTPGFRSRDIQAFKAFQQGAHVQNVALRSTDPRHISMVPGLQNLQQVQEERNPFETKPDGNTVSLEEQSVRMADTQGAYNETATLVQKYMKMYRTALARGSS